MKNFNHRLARRPCDPGALPLPRVSPGGWRWRFVAPGGELVAPGGLCQARRRPAATAPLRLLRQHPKMLIAPRFTLKHSGNLIWVSKQVILARECQDLPLQLSYGGCELRGLVTTCQLSPSKEHAHHTRRTCPSNCLKGIICPACSDASCRHAQGGYDGVMRAPAVDCNFWSL